MKRTLSIILCFVLALSLCSCKKAEDDFAYIKNKGTLVIGVTVFEPMNYFAADGSWTGFDTEFAEAVCEKLGIKAEFVEINWDTKEFELEAKSIDCIWNGFTINEDLFDKVEFTPAYMKNAQAVVVSRNSGITSIEQLASSPIAAEMGSAGAEALADEEALAGAEYIGVAVQTDALFEVKTGSCDACVIDYIMARSMTGAGTDYSELMMLCELGAEEYGIGFRKGSSAVDKVNEAIAALKADGTLVAIAQKYGLADNLCA